MRRALAFLTLIVLVWAGPADAAGQAYLVVMDGINLEHLTDERLDNFRFLLEQGGVGLANAATAGGRTAENAAVTLGAGSRALGPGAGTILHSFDPLEASTAGEVQARRTGVEPPAGSLVMPSIAVINEVNSELMYKVHIGYLADTLAAGGRTVAALVNADGDEIHRPAAAIVADSNGIIFGGRVSTDLLAAQQDYPFGLRSNLEAFIQALDEMEGFDLVIIDLGDASRAQAYSGLTLEGIEPVYKLQALIQMDRLLGELLNRQGEGDLLVVTSLQADRTLGEEQAKWLVPVLTYGSGIEPGLLTSPTTRRDGVIASYDITAAILSHFDLYQAGAIHGQPFKSVEHANPLGYLLVREEQMARTYTLRTPLIKGYIAVIIILLFLAVAALFMKWRRQGLMKLILAAVAASPLVLLVLGIMPGSYWMIPAWIALAAGVALLLQRLEPGRAMRLLGAATALVVVADALLGAWLQQRSILGYDAIAGARYYGIGNEYMGVLLGSTLLAASDWLVRRRVLAALAFGAIVLLLMLPGVGANFGGTLAALLGFSVALTGSSILTNKKHRRTAVLCFAGAAVAMVLLNILGGQSHVGRFFAAVAADPAEFWLAIQRKLEMSWRLVRWSLWSKAFAALLVAALWMLVTNRRLLAKWLGQHWPLVRGIMAAALGALVLNDSGIVAAATTLLYLTLPLLYYEFSSSSRVNDSHSA